MQLIKVKHIFLKLKTTRVFSSRILFKKAEGPVKIFLCSLKNSHLSLKKMLCFRLKMILEKSKGL